MKNSLIMVLFFSCGIIAGIILADNNFTFNFDLSIYALYILLFLIGITIGGNKKALNMIKKINYRVLLIPFSVVAGTLIASAIVSLFMKNLSLREVLSIGSGFGYYSLSSVIITRIRGEVIGVTALIANITREIFTLLFAPLMVKFFGKTAPIASGGATSMDTTLPVITKYSGKEYAYISIINGIILTLLVPFLIFIIL